MLAHPAAEPDKGAGIAMCCTFGDADRRLVVARTAVADPHGDLSATDDLARDTPDWLVKAEPYAELAGKTPFSAREAMVALLRESGDLAGEPTPTTAQGQLL